MDSARSIQQSGRSDVLDSGRTTLSTARVHTAIAALAAERHALEARLQMVEAALAEESGKKAHRVRSGNK